MPGYNSTIQFSTSLTIKKISTVEKQKNNVNIYLHEEFDTFKIVLINVGGTVCTFQI